MYHSENALDVRPRNPNHCQQPGTTPTRCANAPFVRRPWHHRKRIMSERFPGHNFRPFSRQTHFQPRFAIRAPQNPLIRSFPPRFNLYDPKMPSSPHFMSPNRPPALIGNVIYQHSFPPNGAHGSCAHSPDTDKSRGNENCKLPEMCDCDELWIETQASDGKYYYYNATTRQTVWCKPDNVKILSQQQIRELRSAIGIPNSDISPLSSSKTATSMQINPSQQPPSCFMAPPTQTLPLRPTNLANLIMFPPPALNVASPGILIPSFPPPFPFGTNCPNMAPTFTPNSFISSVESIVSPQSTINAENLGNGCETDNNETCLSDTEQIDTISAINDEQQLSTVKAESGNEMEWSKHQTPEGNVYYHNSLKKLSSWEQPCFSYIDADKVPNEMTMIETLEVRDSPRYKTKTSNVGDTVAINVVEAQNRNETDSMKTLTCSDIVTKSFGNQQQTEIEENITAQEIESDKSRPVSSTPVPGTLWCIVWTGDNKVFYYNPTGRVSVWERPIDLLGRADVDKLVKFQPVYMEPKTHFEPEIKKLKMSDDDDDKVNSEDIGCELQVNEEGLSQKDQIAEAEAKAAIDRASIPLNIRVETFRVLLTEKNVSAFSTWEKELHKIVFDSRYLLLSSKGRRHVFETYIKEKAEKEKNSHKKQLQEQRDEFKKLLQEAVTSPRMKFTEFAQRHSKDERFKAVEHMRQKEDIFNDFVRYFRRKDKISPFSLIKAEKRFVELLKEQDFLNKNSKWSEVKEKICNDERFKIISEAAVQEKIFKNFLIGITEDKTCKEKEKQLRMQASLRDREEEVKRTLSAQKKELERERIMHKREESIRSFRALLSDLIHNTRTSWHSAKKTLKKDHRWESLRHLEKRDRNKIFEDHIEFLNEKKKIQFHEFLNEIPEVVFNVAWNDIKDFVLSDPRSEKFSKDKKKCEKQFLIYMEEKLNLAKKNFRELLLETKIITYKSKGMLSELDHLGDIEKALQNDRRYLDLDFMKDERQQTLFSYIEELHNRGPPPPPTASDPQRR